MNHKVNKAPEGYREDDQLFCRIHRIFDWCFVLRKIQLDKEKEARDAADYKKSLG